MRSRTRTARRLTSPRWGRLYRLAVALLAALACVEIVMPPGAIETMVQCGLVLSGFGAMAGWARGNRTALDQQEWCACAGARMTVRVIPSRRPARVERQVEHEHVHARLAEDATPTYKMSMAPASARWV